MDIPHTLVFDIGKTTKKALVFDPSFHILDEKTTHIPENSDDDGFPCEDLSRLTRWVQETLREHLNNAAYNITHINFSGYGASLVYLDKDDKPLEPFYNYLKPFPGGLAERFHATYNPNGALGAETASPWLGMLNSGMQAYWLKSCKPEQFKKVHTILHFPQYFPFLITGNKLTDVTSIGCHTMLWNFRTMGYHKWAETEGIAQLFPPVVSPDFRVSIRIGDKIMTCGSGVHDSSAALLPYLVSMNEPFLLLSTGTWNICFNPFNTEALTRDELEKDCLCYLTSEGKPVKASRIFLGHEHDIQQKALAGFFGVSPDAYKQISFNPRTYQALCEQDSDTRRFYPIGMEGTGPLNIKQSQKTDYTAFQSFEEAQHQLIRSLVQWQKLSIDLVDPEQSIKNIILVGGFSKSPLFIEILKREIPERSILLSDHPRASALGAAWLTHDEAIYRNASALLQVKKA